MMTKQKILIPAMLAIVILGSGCAKPPVEEMNNAAEAVAIAESDINAVRYAAVTLARAKAALANMYTEAASKNYEAAKNFADEAIAMAELSIREGKTQAAKIKNDATTVVNSLKPQLKETEQIITTAKENGLALDYDLIDREFDASYQAMIQACEAFAEENFQDAIKMGNSVRANMDLINRLLSQVAIVETRKK